MPVIGRQRAAKGSRWAVGATNMRAGSWDCTRKADDLDTVNFESAGEDQGTTGVNSTDWSGKGNWDAQQNMFDPAGSQPPGLYPRDDLLNLKFFTNLIDNVFWLIGQARVLSAKNGAEVKGLVTFDTSGKSNGGVTLPTGSN